jgi:mannose-6-phosphate isomerase-like protein (cupin superfamily)
LRNYFTGEGKEADMGIWADYDDYTEVNLEKFHKATIFESDRMLLGINSLEPNQTQKVHQHSGQDKFYFVVEGTGVFQLGDEERAVGPGGMVIAPVGVEHGVRNDGDQRLVLLVCIAPWGTSPTGSSRP